MKKFKKIISLVLAAVLLVSGSAVARADSISTSEELTLTGLNEAAVTQAVENYFDERAGYLLGTDATLDGTVTGIVNDEAAHLEQYADKGIALNAADYEIDSVVCCDTVAEVTVTETIVYTQNGTPGTEEVIHELNVYLDENDVPIVASDAYIETYSGFKSCSYVATSMQTFAVLPGGSKLCVLEIAQSQVGYAETGDNITDYGEWYKWYGPWCAVFVAWCANQANISTSIIPKEADCDEMRKSFTGWGLYYASAAYGGSYTPQVGDIYFKGTKASDATHVGYVVSVSSDSFMVVDGNCENKVRYHSESLTASDIIGFAHPDYEFSGHITSSYTVGTSTHSGTCANCKCAFEEAHSATSYSTNATYHWKTCTLCNGVFEKAAHVMVQVGSTANTKCKTCGYMGVNAII